MSTQIHPTALVDTRAHMGRDVQIGPYCYVGPHVRLGDRTVLHHHATVDGWTTLGAECEVFPQAVLGTRPQDVKYHGEKTLLTIGDRNVIREMVTLHPGTDNGGGVTRIGDDNLLLIGVHVAHDCQIGSRCVFANYVQFAGHVHVEDNVNMGGNSAVHHFVSIGRHAFVGGMTRITADVPPFVVVVAARGTRPEIRMINGVGLQRCGYGHEDIGALKDAYMRIFSRRARLSGVAIRDRVAAVQGQPDINPHVDRLCRFLMRSFAHGRHGRYLESLRRDPVHRDSWKPDRPFRLTVDVIGEGTVHRISRTPEGETEVFELTPQPESGWTFAGWNGSCSGMDHPLRVALDGNKTVTATFTPAAGHP